MTLTIVRTGRKLDLGAGMIREDGYETMDISPVYSPDFQHDLTQLPWPFEDGAFEWVRCLHVLEHIERRHLVPVMNEMHRVLAPEGKAEIEVPVFPFWGAIADPTHVSFFVPQTFWYFSVGHPEYDDHRRLYGIRPWKIADAKRDEWSSVVRVLLEKVE